MKYENGRDLFPAQLLKQIQKYVSGKLVYIPSGERNRDIRSKCKAGAGIGQLSLFRRSCGPEESMRWRINKEWFEKHVNELEEVIKREQDMPPLIVNYFII